MMMCVIVMLVDVVYKSCLHFNICRNYSAEREHSVMIMHPLDSFDLLWFFLLFLPEPTSHSLPPFVYGMHPTLCPRLALGGFFFFACVSVLRMCHNDIGNVITGVMLYIKLLR